MCEKKPCINERCVDGWDTGHPAPAEFPRGREAYLRSCERLRCCTACGGRGYLADARENRRHYYDMRSIANELENDGRVRDVDALPLIGSPVEEVDAGLEAALAVLAGG
jgi:hypothetical protein